MQQPQAAVLWGHRRCTGFRRTKIAGERAAERLGYRCRAAAARRPQ